MNWIILVLILIGVGSKVVDDRPRLKRAGQILASWSFLLMFLVGGYQFGQWDVAEWLGVALLSLVASGCVLGLSWIALTVLALAWYYAVSIPWTSMCDIGAGIRDSRRERLNRRQVEKQIERSRKEYQQQTPERERAARAALLEQDQRQIATRRRADARASALLIYTYFAARLGERFPRSTFDEYVSQFMGDDLAPEVVEERGRKLLAIFEKHLAAVEPPPPSLDLDSLNHWYIGQRDRIKALPIEDDAKGTLEGMLQERFDKLIEDYFEVMRP